MSYTAKRIKVSEVPALIKRELREIDMPANELDVLCQVIGNNETFYFFENDEDVAWFHGEELMHDITYHVDATPVIKALKAIGAIDEDAGDGSESESQG